MLQILMNSGNENNFEQFLELLLQTIIDKIKDYFEVHDLHHLTIIQNYIIFFMVLVLNLKNLPDFIKIIFNGKIKFFQELCNHIFSMKTKKKKQLLSIVSNIFLEEYKDIFFREKRDEELESIFIDQQIDFSNKYLDTGTFFDSASYKKMFEILLNFDLSYSNFFRNNNIKDEDKASYKLCIVQSIIRVSFSKEKKNYYDKEQFYEYNLLKRIIDKDMEETLAKYGDQHRALFRKEDLCDDIIKYMFFIFGNSMLIECFIKPLKNMISKIGITEQMIEKREQLAMKRDITKEEFNKLCGIIMDALSNKIPDIIKIVLKLLYESVNNYFTIEKDNYGPLYTSLIFNFFISPRIQRLYSISPLNCIFIRSLNRLLRNMCFNYKFEKGDPLFEFNDEVEKNHIKIDELIKEKIISIEVNDKMKNSLSDLFTETYLIYPKFLFYLDSQLLCATIIGGIDKIITFEEIATGPSSHK